MSLRMRVKCDMDRFAVSLVRSSKATFTLWLVAPRAWVGRHAAAPWATSERETVALGSQAAGPRETSGETLMPADSAALLIHCQMALGLTQEELRELLCRTRRTI